MHLSVLYVFPWLVAHFFVTQNNIPLSASATVDDFTYEGHLGCFQVWALMNKAALNINMTFLCADVSYKGA
jgi:hypothetical protein